MVDALGEAKKAAARTAAQDYVENGMLLGLGSGSTALHFVEALGRRVEQGLDVRGVATSLATAEAAMACKVPLVDLESLPGERDGRPLDLAVDGADELADDFVMIKGGGASLLREKIVAQAARRMLVLVDESKLVARVGAFALPVEVTRFGAALTREKVAAALAGALGHPVSAEMRRFDGDLLVTDNDNYIVDCHCREIADAAAVAAALDGTVGVVEHGLFLTEASEAIVAHRDGRVKTRVRSAI